MSEITIKCDTNKVSDGYHTFGELYDHRNQLFLMVMKANKEKAWFSDYHHDGTKYDGWFIAGIETPYGQISYHMPVHLFGVAGDTGAKWLATAPEWDGHTSDDVLERLLGWLQD